MSKVGLRYLTTMRTQNSLIRTVRAARRKLHLYRMHLGFLIDVLLLRKGYVKFVCNICGCKCQSPASAVSREKPSCYGCGSTMRYRSVINALSIALWDKPLALRDYPFEKMRIGIGMTDSETYASRLAERLGYTNSYYHREPTLDILDLDPTLHDSVHFILSSDVLEHVAPPVQRAFQNLYYLLRPGGVLVVTVPLADEIFAKEHFPNLFDFHYETRNGNRVLINRTAEDSYEEFNGPVFHGGPGETLEMRVFSKERLIAELKNAGFSRIRVVTEDFLEFGIIWGGDKSVPVVAWK
jgi:SAM-dependent methyltransferase